MEHEYFRLVSVWDSPSNFVWKHEYNGLRKRQYSNRCRCQQLRQTQNFGSGFLPVDYTVIPGSEKQVIYVFYKIFVYLNFTIHHKTDRPMQIRLFLTIQKLYNWVFLKIKFYIASSNMVFGKRFVQLFRRNSLMYLLTFPALVAAPSDLQMECTWPRGQGSTWLKLPP